MFVRLLYTPKQGQKDVINQLLKIKKWHTFW